MRFLLIILLSINIVNEGYSQNNLSPESLGFTAYNIKSEIGNINYYLSNHEKQEDLPLLVYLDGSGPYPLFQQMEQGIGSSVVIDLNRLRNKYRILLISKPGIPFIDKVRLDQNNMPEYNTPKEYTESLSLFWRVDAANLIINRLISENKIDTSKIVVLGFSEGAQVGPFLAKKNKNVSHLILFSGNGLNQFFDPIITARQNAQKGITTEVEAQNIIDSLFNDYKEIYKDPESTKKMWWGHTYLRWASFTSQDPYTVLKELSIPIYIANGSLDENSVLSSDYIALEFIRLQKNNLTYKTYPELDHQFNEIIHHKDGTVNMESKLNEVMNDAYRWMN